jgi:hypothetical protein
MADETGAGAALVSARAEAIASTVVMKCMVIVSCGGFE